MLVIAFTSWLGSVLTGGLPAKVLEEGSQRIPATGPYRVADLGPGHKGMGAFGGGVSCLFGHNSVTTARNVRK